MHPWSSEVLPSQVLSPSLEPLGRRVPGSQLTACTFPAIPVETQLPLQTCSKGESKEQDKQSFLTFLKPDLAALGAGGRLPLTPTPWPCNSDPQHRPDIKCCPAQRHEEHKSFSCFFFPRQRMGDSKGKGKNTGTELQGSQPRKWWLLANQLTK